MAHRRTVSDEAISEMTASAISELPKGAQLDLRITVRDGGIVEVNGRPNSPADDPDLWLGVSVLVAQVIREFRAQAQVLKEKRLAS